MGGKGRNWGKRTTMKVVVRFWDALDGPSTLWVPPRVSPSPIPSSSPSLIPPSSEYEPAHIPLEREGRVGAVRAGALLVGPTSLNRGEGLLAGSKREGRRKGGRWWW